MSTMPEVLSVEPSTPAAAPIARAAAVLRAGGLVAFPTETVYGLGAAALDTAAVGRIFAAKGRPATNPVIVHVAEVEEARKLVTEWPEAADRLAARFWPGPLTLVLPRCALVPDAVTAGGPTVALRIPAHPVALALLRAAGLPVAAPSANRSMQLSPTRAEHVVASLRDRVDLVLDGGPTTGGIESTVLDLSTSPPRVLRPGLVTPTDLEGVLGRVLRSGEVGVETEGTVRSPGQMRKHYAPRTPLRLVVGGGRAIVEAADRPLGWLTFEPSASVGGGHVMEVMPRDPGAYAAVLYDRLHALDAVGVVEIVVELPPPEEPWLAVRDRLLRAAAR